MSRMGKSTQTSSRLAVARVWVGQEWVVSAGGFLSGGDENVLELDNGGGCTTL